MERRTRRQFLAGTGAVGLAGLAGCNTFAGDGGAATTGTDADEPTPTTEIDPGSYPETGDIALDPVADGLVSPVAVVAEPNADRQYVLDQVGVAYRLTDDGIADEPFLDLRDRVEVSPERGLLGLDFHPDYPDDRRFFARYSAPRRQNTPSDYSHTEVLAEFTVTADGPRRRPASERTLIEFPSPTIYHQAGTITFGPDGYLYVTMGEGTMGEFAQDVQSNLLGGIHRIDVDAEGDDRPYGIPSDNPLVGREGRSEFYAWGFRNPWRMSFNDGDLIVGDVGSRFYEEVNVVQNGGNYGWPYREGPYCTGWEGAAESGEHCGVDLSTVPGDDFEPAATGFDYGDEEKPVGTAVIAGYVYDGPGLADLQGEYLFGNYTSDLSKPRGVLFTADRSAERPWPISRVTVSNGPNGDIHRIVNSMGRDSAGRIYLCCVAVPERQRFDATAGEVYRVVPPGEASMNLPPT